MVVTIEEHALNGGMGSIIPFFIMKENLTHLRVKNFGIPDTLIEHGSHEALLEKYGLTAEKVVESINAYITPSLALT
jgi:Deoxyxylulose-5-phosphate synthase